MIHLPNDECTFRTTEDEVHATVIPEIGLIVKFYRPIDGDYWYGKCPLTGDNDAIPTGQNVRLERKYQQSLMAEQGARIAELEEALNKIISLYPNKGGIMRTMAKNVLARGDKEAQS